MAGAQSDDVVWAVIGAGEGSFCSYKIKAPSTKTVRAPLPASAALCSHQRAAHDLLPATDEPQWP